MKSKLIGLSLALPWLPGFLYAQSGIANDLNGLQKVLDTIYDQMLPLCSSLIGVGQGIAGFAATWYIAVRVWRHIANAEPVDFYPLFRPFVLGFAILVFPSVIGLMNSILKPTVSATSSMVADSDQAIAMLLKQKEAAIQNTTFYQMYVGPNGSGDIDKWEQYSGAADDGVLSGISNSIKFEIAKASYNFRNAIKEWLSEILQLLYSAASLCINTIRTFYLIVLAILGPLVFGIAVFDGLHHTLSAWIARYINIFLWLPVANIFGSILGRIEQNMIQLDINQIQANGDTYFSSMDTGYLIFLLIGIVGYFTVPSMANHIVNAGGSGGLLSKSTAVFAGGTQSIISKTTGGMGVAANAFSSGASKMSGNVSGSGSTDRGTSQGNSNLKNRITGTKND
jgi:conjugative transposon TraJ protein